MDAQHILESPAAEKIERFRIRGMHCANCANTIEKAISPIPGVIDAHVNFAAETLTARVNDEGWDTCYSNWLRRSRLNEADMVFVFSVGGGDAEKNISTNLVRALEHARAVHATICGVVGRDGGYTAQVADAYVLVPVVNPSTITPHTESFQAMIWHLLVSHPKLRVAEMKWESVRPEAKV